MCILSEKGLRSETRLTTNYFWTHRESQDPLASLFKSGYYSARGSWKASPGRGSTNGWGQLAQGICGHLLATARLSWRLHLSGVWDSPVQGFPVTFSFRSQFVMCFCNAIWGKQHLVHESYLWVNVYIIDFSWKDFSIQFLRQKEEQSCKHPPPTREDFPLYLYSHTGFGISHIAGCMSKDNCNPSVLY